MKLALKAQVVKLVDTPDLGSGAVRCVGSSPILGKFAGNISEMTMFPVFLCPNRWDNLLDSSD